ncbi:stevor [Plasmodium sp. gorilla clade G1]|nr:stevor [Plasmodium sp. gorilla clade G1]
MKMHYLKMLLFTFLINTLVLPHYENFVNNYYNVSLIQNNTQIRTIKSRILAQTQKHNPHYHNDPELKKIIDQLNEEAIREYQKTHDPYKQLKEVVEKNGTKYTGGNDVEHISTLEKELLETYKEVFGDESDMLKSGMNPNVDEKSSTCECTDINGVKLEKTKGRDKYLKHLKHRCTRGICFCSVGSAFITMLGLYAAKAAAVAAVLTVYGEPYNTCIASSSFLHMFDGGSLAAALQAGTTTCARVASDISVSAAGAAVGAFPPYGIAALVLLILVVVLIILYIWLYRRRKRSLKHECKKHLCK